ncbi:cuticle protein 16.8-like [Panonychus citri]|uniref:cuticle protein 16.8-like n=1 Tax=Panonychus citri TaxID=50023 RepID=UPI002307D2F5|nr:cuticle protein 16.8-like [Panonychus citri]
MIKSLIILGCLTVCTISSPAYYGYSGPSSRYSHIPKAAYAIPAPSYASPKASYAEPLYEHKPQPYSFGYDINDGYGNKNHKQEEGDEYGAKRGSYGYTDAHGIYRKVDYVADKHGFRATVSTNEPGTAPKDPADVKMIVKESPPSHSVYAAPAYLRPSYAPAYDHPKPSGYSSRPEYGNYHASPYGPRRHY